MTINERALGDLDTVETVDATEPLTPENFSMDAFLAGVRPTRRSVKLYPNAHLLARMDEIVAQIEATPADDDVDALIDEYETCREQFRTGVTFTIEKRSSEWEKKFRKDLIADLKLKVHLEKDGTGLEGKAEDRSVVVLHQLAAQIVSPAGVTYEQLVALQDANEGELTKLLSLQRTVNTLIAESAEILNRDFSQRRSGNAATVGS